MEKLKVHTLRRALKKRGKTGNWLAEKVGVTSVTAYSWLCGMRNPSAQSITLIAQRLKMKRSELVWNLDSLSKKRKKKK